MGPESGQMYFPEEIENLPIQEKEKLVYFSLDEEIEIKGCRFRLVEINVSQNRIMLLGIQNARIKVKL